MNAESILTRALESAKTIQEFHLFIAYELALLYDQRQELDEATRLYRVVLDAPRPKRHAAAIEAEIKARKAENRLLMIKSDRARNVIGLLLLVLLAIGFVLFLRHKPRPPSPLDHGKGGFYLPYEMPTGLSLDELKGRFQTIPDITPLVAKRLAYSYAILFDRALIRAYITDDYLQPQVEEDRLKDNTTLFLCIAPIETVVDQHVFSGRPENSIRAHLDTAFKKHGWPWPTHPTEWKRYFMYYHMELLFGVAPKHLGDTNGGEEDTAGDL